MWTVVHCNVCLCDKNLINTIYFETFLQRILKLKSVAKGENVTVAFRVFVIFSTSKKIVKFGDEISSQKITLLEIETPKPNSRITHDNLLITLKFSQDT
jgi:hypothetical protein